MEANLKLDHPAIRRLTGMFGAWILRFWATSQRVRYHMFDHSVDPRGRHARCIYVCWHECLLMPVGLFSRNEITVLASQSHDAEWLSQIMLWLGGGVVRGSTTRGGMRAVRELLRLAGRKSLATAIDGPRGPRRRAQIGIIYLAWKTGLPIAPFGYGYRRPWRARSWDRFVLPRPFERASCVGGRLIRIPPDADDNDLEGYRAAVQAELDRVQEYAELMIEEDDRGRQSPARALTESRE